MKIPALKSPLARHAADMAPGLTWLTVLGLVLLSWSGAAAADEPSDIVFRSINATTGEPCTLDRLLLQESTMTMDEVGRIEPLGSIFTIDDVRLVDARSYVVTAWFEEVPYYWEFRGRFIDQDTNTIHVFSTTAEAEGVVVSGLNVILKKQDSLASLEYVLQLDNRIMPQATVVNDLASFEMMFPAAATAIEAVCIRGPNGTPVETRALGDRRLGLKIPLTPGRNRIQIKALLEWQPNLEIPVGSSLPVEAWSLLGSPEYLEFQSFDLEPDPDNTVPGMCRFIGPALEAGRTVVVRVDSNPPPAVEGDLFSRPDSATQATESPATPRSRGWRSPVPPALLALAAVLIVSLGILQRRRSKKPDPDQPASSSSSRGRK